MEPLFHRRAVPIYYSTDGLPPCLMHNYPAAFRSAGFEVLHYRTYAPACAGRIPH